jgi:hypothetical protein
MRRGGSDDDEYECKLQSVMLFLEASQPPSSQDSKKRKPLAVAKGGKKSAFDDDIDFRDETDDDKKVGSKGANSN